MNLKVSAFYLEKQKSFITKKNFFGRTAKVHPKDGVSRLNFPEGFGGSYRVLPTGVHLHLQARPGCIF